MVGASGADVDGVAQRYRARLPHPVLRDLVSTVFIHEVAPDSRPYQSRNIPEGTVEVFYRLGSTSPFVAHPLESTVKIVEPGSAFVGIQLRHGAAGAVLGVPASELVGREDAFGSVGGPVASAIGGRLAEAESPERAARLLEQEVIRRCVDSPGPDPVVRELVRRLRPWRARRVSDQTKDLFVSPRQLRRRCLRALGYGPKTLHRLLRFQAFFALVHYRADCGDLTRLAIRAGYADQAHLTRECLRVAGLTPRAFVADRAATCVGSHDHSAWFAELGPLLCSAGVAPARPLTTFTSRAPLSRQADRSADRDGTAVSFKTRSPGSR